jgi:hypothetical protein
VALNTIKQTNKQYFIGKVEFKAFTLLPLFASLAVVVPF